MPFIIGLFYGKIGQLDGSILALRQPKIKDGALVQTPIVDSNQGRTAGGAGGFQRLTPQQHPPTWIKKTAPHPYMRTGRLTTMQKILKDLRTCCA